MATPIAYQKISTSKGIIDVPIYNEADVAIKSLRIQLAGGIGCYDLVTASPTTPLRVMTPDGIKGINLGATGQPQFTTIVSDSFNRADNASSLGTAETGQAWVAVDGVFGIVSQKAKMTTLGSIYPQAVVNAGVSNCTVSMDVTYVTNNGGGINFRVKDVLTFLHCVVNKTGLVVSKYDNYVSTTLGSYAFVPTNVATYHISVELNGESIKAFLNGIERISITNTFNVNETKHGIRIPDGMAMTFDNFTITVPYV